MEKLRRLGIEADNSALRVLARALLQRRANGWMAPGDCGTKQQQNRRPPQRRGKPESVGKQTGSERPQTLPAREEDR